MKISVLSPAVALLLAKSNAKLRPKVMAIKSG